MDRQRQCVGDGAGGDQIDRSFGSFEGVAQLLRDMRHQRIGTVAARKAVIGAGDCGDDFGRGARGVVRGEEHHMSS